MPQRQTWQVSGNAAEIYEEYFVPAIFGEWAQRSVAAAELSPGHRLLDVACGTGVVARACAERVGPGGKVIGLDLNDGMIAVARRLRPEIEWRQGDAAALPFGDATFDRVVCQFGLMFFPDRVAALKEMWRVLAPGGRLVVAVWASIETIQPYVVLADLSERHAGPEAADVIRSPFVLGDTAALPAMFRAAGLPSIEVATESGLERFRSLEACVQIEIKGSPAAGFFDDEAYAALLRDATEQLASWRKDDGRVEFASQAHIITARKG